jgi:hypothetical protein
MDDHEIKPGYVYILRREDLGLYRIGATRRLSHRLKRLRYETESVLFCCQLYDQPLQVVKALRKQYERNLVVCTQWYSLRYPPVLPVEGQAEQQQPASPQPGKLLDPAWLDRRIIETCKRRKLTASQYRSQFLTRSKHQFYSTEYIASRMAMLAESGALQATLSPALNARGAIYYSATQPGHSIPLNPYSTVLPG